MAASSIRIKNAEICWKIEKLFLFLRIKDGASSPKISLNNKTWNFVLYNFELEHNFHIYIFPRDESLLEDGEIFNIRISKIDGSSYIDENVIQYTTPEVRGYKNPTPLTNLLEMEKSLSKDGSLSVFISFFTGAPRNPIQQADIVPNIDTHRVLTHSRDVSSQTISVEGVETLSKDLKKLLASGRHTDVKIIVEGKEFQAHKCVLSARSTVLDSMFSQQMLENLKGVVNISDCSSEAFQDFLTFLYSGKLDGIISSRIVGLYEIADKYDIQELKKECVKRCLSEMSVDSVCDALRIAALHDDEAELMEKATNFFIENTQDILKSSEWETFHEEYPRIANELFLKSFTSLNLSKTSK